jgi:hypothetical protein
MRLFSLSLVALSSGLLVPQSAIAAEKPSGPRLILAMQAPSTTLAPALPTPPPETDCAAPATSAAAAQALAKTAPPAVSLSGTLLQWGRAERRAERRQSLFHPLRRILTVPGRVILTPYTHPVASGE